MPVSIAVLTVAATAVPALARPPKPVIDYLGILVIAVATTALIMATSWGGTTYAWGSATIVGLLIGAAVALGFFVWLEAAPLRPSCRPGCLAAQYLPCAASCPSWSDSRCWVH